MHKKKGQMTVFIAIGVVIVLGIAILLIMHSSGVGIEADTQDIDLAARQVDTYVTSCIEKTLERAVFENSYHGGYFVLPEESTSGLADDVPYYSKDGDLVYPSEQVIAEQIALYVDGLLPLCLADVSALEVQGYEVSAGEPSSRVVFSSEGSLTVLHADVNVPVKIKMEDAEKRLKAFSAEIPAGRFYESYLLSQKIAGSMAEKGICISCLSGPVPEGGEVTVDIQSLGDGAYIIDITDKGYQFEGYDHHMRFALR